MKKKPPVPAVPTPADTGLEALAWAVSSGSADKVIRRVAQKRRRRVTVGAAGLLILLLAAFLFRPVPSGPVIAPPESLVSLPVRRHLSDGSVVDLKDGARLAVAFTPEFRRVELEQGEAHFAVAKNKARPFIVRVGGVEFRAVGTAFDVQLGVGTVELVVTEGRVAVEPVVPGASPFVSSPLFVDAGNRVSVDLTHKTPAWAVQAMTLSEETDRLAWRIPRLNFSGTPLADAIPLFNAHTTGARLSLDPALGRLEVSGNIRADDSDTLLLLLKNEFGIAAAARPDGTIYLHRP